MIVGNFISIFGIFIVILLTETCADLSTISLDILRDNVEKIGESLKVCSKKGDNTAILATVSQQIEWRRRISISLLSGDIGSLNCEELGYLVALDKLTKVKNDESKSKISLMEASDTTSYSTLFEDNVAHNKPFKGRLESAWDATGLSLDFQNLFELTNNATGDSSLFDHILSLDEQLQIKYPPIPKVAVSNYLWKIKNISTVLDDSIDILRQWPSVQVLNRESTLSINQCPANLHQVLWAPSETVAIKIFTTKSAGAVFQPIYGVQNLELNISFHYKVYQSSETPYGDAALKYKEFVLNPNEYAFIPHTYVSSIESSRISKESAVVFRACILDASNLNDFRNVISVYSRVSMRYREILDILSNNAFDFTMNRMAKDSHLQQLRQLLSSSGEKVPDSTVSDIADRKDRRKRQGSNHLREWQDNNKWNMLISSLTLPKPDILRASSIGRNNVTFSWISPYNPLVGDRTTFGFRVKYCQWGETNETIDHEEQVIVDDSLCQSVRAYKVSENLGTKNNDGNNKNSIDHLPIVPLGSSKDTTNGDDTRTIYTVTVGNLQSNLKYTFSLSILYHQYESMFSEPSEPLQTIPVSPPSPIPCRSGSGNGEGTETPCLLAYPRVNGKVTLHFVKPYDDGGLPLVGYHVYARIHSDEAQMHSNGWQWMGLVPSSQVFEKITSLGMVGKREGVLQEIVVGNLHVKTRYHFKVKPCNALGQANGSSGISNEVLTSLEVDQRSGKAARNVNYGWRHHLFGGVNDGRQSTDAVYLHIDDASEVAVLKHTNPSIPDEAFEIWRCHWSPLAFNIESPFVWAEPRLADADLTNIDAVRGAIALVLRGQVSLAAKALRAQAAGAIAVVVVDDGACKTYDQSCLPGNRKILGQGFARLDPPKMWEGLRIPVVFALKAYADKWGKSVASETIEIVDRSRDFANEF